ncbi:MULTISPECIES: HPP family protein [Achromobacter]|uniref:HPP family protein n=1 Tax=Achromobacter spanius TaxID=217203 RepID=A0ABY8GX90_9BURK|nr:MULTISPECIES: HPP family protein [Achromobacter]WAI81637.1 HPP family protein [Achromobacter spanius]WEX97156.1 HPP family protein [Achromobacter sp. SS2-2022]WFP09129.1 HPP family protein [Achromobacter spanius]
MGVAIKRWLSAFAPAPVGVNGREKILGVLGALLGLFCTEWVGRHALGAASPWFIAPMGASAVLLFAAPASPLAQPWSIMAGNLVSALIGVFCAQMIPVPGVAAAVAVALAIGAMFSLRCLHPPSGAVALTAVLGGPSVTALGYGFALWPVGLNSLILLCIAVAFNGALKRNYPRRHADPAQSHHTRDAAPSTRLGFSRADLDDALAQRGELLDISKEDLEDIVLSAELRASVRRFGEVSCADIMSRDVVTVQEHDPLDHAVRLFDRHRLQGLAVVDANGRYAGMVSQADVLARKARPLLLKPDDAAPPEPRVADCMRSEVPFATPDLPAIELARPMSDALHCVPVLDASRNLLGLITQSDLVAALYQMTVSSHSPVNSEAGLQARPLANSPAGSGAHATKRAA